MFFLAAARVSGKKAMVTGFLLEMRPPEAACVWSFLGEETAEASWRTRRAKTSFIILL
jgi:hypothetical protein